MQFLSRGMLVCFGLLFVGCTSDDEGHGVNIKDDPYGSYTTNTRLTFTGSAGGNSNEITKFEALAPSEDTVIGTQSYTTYKLGFVSSRTTELATTTSQYARIYGEIREDHTIIVKGGVSKGFYSQMTGMAALDLFDGSTMILDTPLVLNFDDMAVGEVREKDLNPVLLSVPILGDISLPIFVSYGPTEENVTYQSPELGTLTGCRKFELKAYVNSSVFPLNDTIKIAAYYHPIYSIVGYESAQFGLGMSMVEQSGYGSNTPGINVIQKTQVINDMSDQFLLSTYDRAGQFDADCSTHAQMLVEIRYADSTDAVSSVYAPDGGDVWYGGPLRVVFESQGGMGYFGSSPLVWSPFSILHPEDNGKGYNFWYQFVDQAQKNIGYQGSTYGIKVDYRNFASTPVKPFRISARIGYNLLAPGQYY